MDLKKYALDRYNRVNLEKEKGKSKEIKSDQKENPLKTAYLLLYNLICTAGWAYVLYVCVKNMRADTIDKIWTETEQILKIVQTMAVLEIGHNIFNIVPGSPIITTMQVFSRVWTLWAVMNVVPEKKTDNYHISIALACTSWALVEVPRYLFYATKLLNATPG